MVKSISTSQYNNNLNIDAGIQVGNAFVDAAHAALNAVDALKKVKDAKDKLDRIEDLHDQDHASGKAVERAKYQLALAMFNAGLLTYQAFQAAAGAAGTTETGGMYGSAYANITKTQSNISTDLTQSLASNLMSGDSISLTSGNSDIAITGSNVSSTNGDINLIAMLGNINIKAGETTQSQEMKSSSRSLGGSVGNNGASLNIGFGESESSFDKTTYTNSTLTAENGTIKLNSKEDTNIIGANLLAQNIILNTQGNLTIKSKQNLTESDSYSIGASIGGGVGPNGPTGSVGFNTGSSEASRAWVDSLTTVIGKNSVTINTGNNTIVAPNFQT